MSKSMIRDLLKIFKSGVSAVLPENLVRNSIKFNAVTETFSVFDDNFNLSNKNVYMVGTGKAVQGMAKEIELILGPKLKKGIVSIPVGNLDKSYISEKVVFFEGAINNLPDAQAESTARKIQDLVLSLNKDDLLIVLISGGGSALLPSPKRPITLAEKTNLIKKLSNLGADITQLNVVRKKLSDLKGGRLAIQAQPAQVISLILSDIVGDPLDLIASGPTAENKDGANDATEIIDHYNLGNELPDSIKTVLNDNTKLEEFPKKYVRNYIIGSNTISIKAAVEEAQKLNYLSLNISHAVTGHVNDIAKKYVEITKIFCNVMSGEFKIEMVPSEINSIGIAGTDGVILDKDIFNADALCLILGGEITVEVKGSGKGGRNQHLALEYANILHNSYKCFNRFEIYFLSAGTDGIDGPTNAAGAIGYLDLIADAKKQNIYAQQFLDNNDTYNFYRKFENGKLHVMTGHTNTNVMDLHVILIRKML